MKETPKETDNIIKDSIEGSNNEIQTNNNNLVNFKYVNKYTPFKFKLDCKIRKINNDLKKYYGFTYYENSNKNTSDENNIKNKKENNNINDIEKKDNNENNFKQNTINKNDANINSSYNSNNNINMPFINNLDNLINIVREDDENEYSESEENRVVVDYHSYSDDDFGVGFNYTVRKNSCLKILVVKIVDTYNTIDPNYKYQIKEEEEKNIILTEPSEGVNNNGKDNENDDLIVCKEEEIKNEKKNVSYIIKSLLGTGVSGQAFKAFCPNNKNYYALKIIKNKEILKKMCLFEIKIMQFLNERDKNDQYHIIRLFDYFMYNNHLCIVIELLHKTLLQLLEMNNMEGISLNSIRFILKQILSAVDFIHSLKIIHTDLKPENILLTVYKGDNNETGNSNLNLSNINNQKNNLNQINLNNNTSGIKSNNISNISLINKRVNIKIADFGAACLLKNLDNKLYIQSLYYRAPEVILHLKQKNEKVDIWSIGCILGELYLGTPIMPGNTSYDQLYKINILLGEVPQYMIEQSNKRDKYFKKDKFNNYRIKSPEEFYKENPDIPKKEYEIPKNMKNIDDLINVKKDIIKSKNSLHKSMHNSSLSLNSSNTKEDLVALIHLMKVMLQIDPKKRWSCKQCLKHPFLTKEKLDKFITFELNQINQFMSNSFNSNNSYNYNNNKNNYHSMIMNNSFNQFLMNRGGNLNKNNTFYGGNYNKGNINNYSFGNFNNNNFNYNQYPYPPLFPQNQNINNIYPDNNNNIINNNNYQGNNNYKNKKLNSSFSYNNNNFNYNNLIQNNNIPYQFPQNFIPYQNNAYYGQNNYAFNNPNFNKNYTNYINYNNQNVRHNNTFMGSTNEKLNSSYNSNISKNNKSNKQIPVNMQHFHKNKKNINPNEFLFNKENIILGNLEDNKQEIKNKDNINEEKKILSNENKENDNKENDNKENDNNINNNDNNDMDKKKNNNNNDNNTEENKNDEKQ